MNKKISTTQQKVELSKYGENFDHIFRRKSGPNTTKKGKRGYDRKRKEKGGCHCENCTCD